MREHFGIPVIISSGYRCPALNRALGGVPNSQHLKGEAADIILPPLTLNTHHSTLNTQRMVLLAYRQRSLRPTGFRIQRHHQMDSRQLQDGPEREPPMHLQEDCIIGFSYRRELKLDARAKYPDCSLADLYDELTMPPELRKAHQENDKAVLSPLF